MFSSLSTTVGHFHSFILLMLRFSAWDTRNVIHKTNSSIYWGRRRLTTSILKLTRRYVFCYRKFEMFKKDWQIIAQETPSFQKMTSQSFSFVKKTILKKVLQDHLIAFYCKSQFLASVGYSAIGSYHLTSMVTKGHTYAQMSSSTRNQISFHFLARFMQLGDKNENGFQNDLNSLSQNYSCSHEYIRILYAKF